MKISVYDNEGRFDRYTIVIEVGMLVDFYTMSSNPLDNDGFNQWVGSNNSDMKLKKGKHLGKNIGWDGANDQIKQAILNHLKGY